MNNPHGLQVFDDPFEASDFQETHLCSECWENLHRYPDGNGGYILLCIYCGESTRGYVTEKYVTRRLEKSVERAMIAKDALRPYVKWLQREPTTIEQDLKDLGF